MPTEVEHNNMTSLPVQPSDPNFKPSNNNSVQIKSNSKRHGSTLKGRPVNCSLCDNVIASEICEPNFYRRCTDTSHQTDFTICNSCFHQGLHNSHNDQIHTFSCNYESQYLFYYACGILLDSPPEFMQCQKYVDFLLCPHCVKKKFHKGHVYLMEKATLYFK